MTNMNALDDTTWQVDTLTENASVYDVPVEDTEGHDNPIIIDDIRYSSVEQPPAYESLRGDTPLITPSNMNIDQHNNTPQVSSPRAHPPEVPHPRVDNNAQEPSADTKYQVLLHENGKIGNTS